MLGLANQHHPHRSASGFLAVVILVLLAVAMLANSMTKPVGRDEQMYCTAGVLMAQGRLPYRDFSYAAQLPYHPLLYAAVFRVTGTTSYLLAGRLVSVVCDLLVMVLIVAIYRLVVGTGPSGTWLGIGAAGLYVFNPLVDYANGYAWNHDVVALLVLASLWLLISMDPRSRSFPWKAAAIAALLGLASGMRATTVLTIPVFKVALWLHARRSGIRGRIWMVPFGVAFLAVSIWPIWMIAQAPQTLWLNLVAIPRLYGQWLQEIGMIYDKASLTWQCLTSPGYLAILLLLVALVAQVGPWRRRSSIIRLGPFAVTIALAGVSSLIAFIPPTMWLQYWAMPVPFLVAAMAFPLSSLARSGGRGRFQWACGLMVLGVLVSVASNLLVFLRMPLVTDTATWEPIRIHQLARDIGSKVPAPKQVLTLAPLLALEGGCQIYPELSCGSIIYRIADQLTPSQRALTHTVGPQALRELAEGCPASAVIVGAEDKRLALLEDPLLVAVGPNWQEQSYPNKVVLYYRSTALSNP